jgi:hypothetical protein
MAVGIGHFLLTHALAALFWVPVAWGLVKLKYRVEDPK